MNFAALYHDGLLRAFLLPCLSVPLSRRSKLTKVKPRNSCVCCEIFVLTLPACISLVLSANVKRTVALCVTTITLPSRPHCRPGKRCENSVSGREKTNSTFRRRFHDLKNCFCTSAHVRKLSSCCTCNYKERVLSCWGRERQREGGGERERKVSRTRMGWSAKGKRRAVCVEERTCVVSWYNSQRHLLLRHNGVFIAVSSELGY